MFAFFSSDDLVHPVKCPPKFFNEGHVIWWMALKIDLCTLKSYSLLLRLSTPNRRLFFFRQMTLCILRNARQNFFRRPRDLAMTTLAFFRAEGFPHLLKDKTISLKAKLILMAFTCHVCGFGRTQSTQPCVWIEEPSLYCLGETSTAKANAT